MTSKKGRLKRPILTIAIPVYNEENTLAQIIDKVINLKFKDYEIIVVNDASSDSSAEIIKNGQVLADRKKVPYSIYTHPKNRGKGAGIKTALKHAKGRYFVVQDADLEYSPPDILPLIKAALEGNRPVVYGSRFMGTIEQMPYPNYLANRFYNFLLRRLYDTSITDMHTCYKMIKTDIVRNIKLGSEGFDYAPELISNLLRHHVPIYEVPISFVGRTKKDGKKINVTDGLRCVYLILAYRFIKSGNVRSLSKRLKLLAKFITVGFVGFMTNYGVLELVHKTWGVSKVISEIIAALTALQITFILHESWTYRTKAEMSLSIRVRYMSYLMSNSLGSIMTVVLFGLLSNYLANFYSLVIAASLALVWNFFMNTFIIWQRRQTANGRDLEED